MPALPRPPVASPLPGGPSCHLDPRGGGDPSGDMAMSAMTEPFLTEPSEVGERKHTPQRKPQDSLAEKRPRPHWHSKPNAASMRKQKEQCGLRGSSRLPQQSRRRKYQWRREQPTQSLGQPHLWPFLVAQEATNSTPSHPEPYPEQLGGPGPPQPAGSGPSLHCGACCSVSVLEG